jgi:TolB-like protein/Flp pilus assembly protein TadD/predicted Ser/Thr protein kinase
MIGQQLAHFRLVDKIGEGGMGVVYKAHDERLDRDVAIKVLPAESLGDPASRSRLLREARTASKLNHPNICTIHEVGEAEGQAFIAMELVEGPSLSALVTEGALPGDQVLRYGLHMADALAHAHKRGVVHRDFKSANVVITTEGRAKVLDFGLARRLTTNGLAELRTLTQNTLTMPGQVAGTLAYMAPEQLRGQPADERSDVWALGVVLYEMAAGVRPFQGDTGFELSSSILNQEPPPLRTGTRGSPPVLFRSVIERCLEKDPGRRYQKAGEVRAALEAVQAGAALPVWTALKYAVKRHWKLALAAALTVAIAAVAVLDVGGLRSRLLSLVPRPSFRSLAVLPVENLSGDPEQEYFTDGMTAALIADLSKIGALRVIAQSSVMRYKNAHKPLKEIARELDVEAVLESSVIREADRVRVTAQLGEAVTERNLWAESFERESSSILAIQAEVVQHVVEAVRVKLKSQEKARLGSARKANPEVYELYLKGMYSINKYTPEDFQKGLAYFNQAVEKDPADALGYAGLAIGYAINAHNNPEAREDSLNRAKAAAATALRLNDSLAEVQTSMGLVKCYLEWQWEEAFGYLNRAIEISPNMAEAYLHRAWLHVLFGRTEEALKDHMRVKQVDPFNGLNLGWLAELYRMQGRYDEAEAEALKCIEVEPTLGLGPYILGLIYQDRGDHDKAIEAIRKAGELWPGMQWALGAAYIKAGRTEEARKMLDELNKMKTGPMRAFWKAQIYAYLGENDEAFRWLRFEPHHAWVPWVRVLDWLEPLKKDPRFPDLLRHMNLPPLQPASR